MPTRRFREFGKKAKQRPLAAALGQMEEFPGARVEHQSDKAATFPKMLLVDDEGRDLQRAKRLIDPGTSCFVSYGARMTIAPAAMAR